MCDCGLARKVLAKTFMCTTRDSGDCICMFQSGSKYHLWNLIEGNIWEILTSMDLVNIVTELAKPKLGSLKLVLGVGK
jgi:hypothetical protein